MGTGSNPTTDEVILPPIDEICTVFQAREFLEHRYYKSQALGYDVGNRYTMDNWVESGHAARFRAMFDENKDAIPLACARYCNKECGVYALHRRMGRKNGIDETEVATCPMPSAEMHELIEKRPV